MIEEPNGYDKKYQYHDCNSHRGAVSDSLSVVVVYIRITCLIFGFLFRSQAMNSKYVWRLTFD